MVPREVKTHCLFCGKIIVRVLSAPIKFYCNKECYDKSKKGKKRPNHSLKMKAAHKKKSFGYRIGENVGDNNPAKRLEVRKKLSEKAKKGKDNYFSQHIFAKEKNWNWQGGKSFEAYGFDFTEELKRLIRKRDNSQCQICKRFGKDVHHIDYNKKNNDPKNLVTLCKHHHGKSGTNRKDWILFFQGGTDEQR